MIKLNFILSDFTDYEIEIIDLIGFQYFFKSDNRIYIPICSLSCNDKLFKIFENKIAIFCYNTIFVIKFNNNLIF